MFNRNREIRAPEASVSDPETHRKRTPLERTWRSTNNYESFKKKYADSDMNTIIQALLTNYSEDERYSMIKLHLDSWDAPKDMQKAFAIVRGMDVYAKIQNTPIEDTSEAYHQRYETFYKEGYLDIYTKVRGHKNHCYRNFIYLKGGEIKFDENFKSRPEDDRGNFKVGRIDDEVEPFQIDSDGVQKTIEGTKPLSNTDIIYHQLLHEAKEESFNLAEFKLQKMRGQGIQNAEARRTMSLFVERGEKKTFNFGDPEYYAGVPIPGGNSKWRLLKRLDSLNLTIPNYVIPKYEVTRTWDNTITGSSIDVTYYVSTALEE